MTQDTIPGELSAIHARLDDGDKRFAAFEVALAENTATTQRVESNTAALVEILDAAQGAFKVLRWIGKAAKPIGYIAGAIAAIIGVWTALRGGGIGPR